MNQILYIDKNKNKNGNSLEINSILKIFAIAIIILGVILIGKGVYGIVVSSNQAQGQEPIVATKQIEGKLQLNITHNIAIDKVIYSWNNEEEVIMQGRGQTNIVETIQMPVGTNTLNLKIIDSNKKETTYIKQYYKADRDMVEPEIELVVEGSKVKIVAKDETKLHYIMYRWNEEDNTVVEAREESPKKVEEKISILKGENKLTIIAVDSAGNETTKEQMFKGAKKPTIEVVQENDELVIKVKDEESIKKIDITLNGEYFSTDPENTGASLNMAEVELRQKLKAGENTITVTVYNISGLSEQVTQQVTI